MQWHGPRVRFAFWSFKQGHAARLSAGSKNPRVQESKSPRVWDSLADTLADTLGILLRTGAGARSVGMDQVFLPRVMTAGDERRSTISTAVALWNERTIALVPRARQEQSSSPFAPRKGASRSHRERTGQSARSRSERRQWRVRGGAGASALLDNCRWRVASAANEPRRSSSGGTAPVCGLRSGSFKQGRPPGSSALNSRRLVGIQKIVAADPGLSTNSSQRGTFHFSMIGQRQRGTAPVRGCPGSWRCAPPHAPGETRAVPAP
jgi:hypothetical protein